MEVAIFESIGVVEKVVSNETARTRSHSKLWVADQACKTEPRPLGSGDAPCGVPVGNRFLTGAVRIIHKNRRDGALSSRNRFSNTWWTSSHTPAFCQSRRATWAAPL